MKAISAILLSGLFLICSCVQPAQKEAEKADEGKNVVIETIMTRRSVRQYQPQAVNRDTMQLIVECGINAPNAINRQAWEVRIVDNPEVIKKLTDLYLKDNPKEAENPNFKNMFRNAPTVAFIANDTTFAYSSIDCGLMAENMILSAWSMGIGSCCLGGPARFRKLIQRLTNTSSRWASLKIMICCFALVLAIRQKLRRLNHVMHPK